MHRNAYYVDMNNATQTADNSNGALVADARQRYISLFGSLSEAVDFEAATLSIGDEFLPACSLAVLQDRDADSVEHYAFLAGARIDEQVVTSTVKGDATTESSEMKTEETGPPLARCTTCELLKCPLGRSAPMEMYLCSSTTCNGYEDSPRPSTLWPGEEGWK